MRALPLLLLAASAAADPGTNLRSEFVAAYRATTGRPRYEIDLVLDDRGGFRGRMTLHYTNRRKQGIGAVDLELFPVRFRRGALTRSLALDGEVRAEGQVLRVTTPTNGRLQVWLPRLLMPGQATALQLGFSGRLPGLVASGTGLGFPFGSHRGFHYLYAFHPVLALETASGWSAPPPEEGFGDLYRAEVADWKVRVTAPEGLEVVVPGVEVGHAGRTVEHRAEGLRDFTVLAGRGLRRTRRKAGAVELVAWHRPELATQARRSLTLAAGALAVFGRRFGAYPYRRLQLVFGPLPHSGGMEHSTLVVIGDYPLPKSYLDVVVHEVAHQWWYLLVGTDQPSWPFLDEGLAAYSEWVYLAHAQGSSALARRVRHRLRLYSGRHALLSPIDAFANEESYGRTVYVDGAYWHLKLDRQAGRERYLKALRRYAERHRWAIASPAALAETLRGELGRGVEPLLRQLRGPSREARRR